MSPVCAGDPEVACMPLSATNFSSPACRHQWVLLPPPQGDDRGFALLHGDTGPSATTVSCVGVQLVWEGPHHRAESLGSLISCTDRQASLDTQERQDTQGHVGHGIAPCCCLQHWAGTGASPTGDLAGTLAHHPSPHPAHHSPAALGRLVPVFAPAPAL